MPTPNSALVAYCTPAQLLFYHDARQIGDALSDLGVRVQANQIPTDPNVLELLSWASAQVESACFVADRYSAADLVAVQNSAQVGASLLRGLVADLAWWKLKQRRAAATGIKAEASEGDLLAFKMLDDLREGRAIFGLQEKGDAGLVDTNYVDIGQLQLNNFTTEQAGRFFGQRADEARTFTSGSPAVDQ
jgi:hypothetical protein